MGLGTRMLAAPGAPRGGANAFRTTEIVKQTGGTWPSIVDHASIGEPPPTP